MCGKATQPFCFIKPTIIKKLAYVVKYITQINGGLIKIFWKFENKIFFELVGSVVNNMEKINRRKRNTINRSGFKVLGQLSYYLIVTDTLKIPLIFIFLSCFEKVRDNKHFFLNCFLAAHPPSPSEPPNLLPSDPWNFPKFAGHGFCKIFALHKSKQWKDQSEVLLNQL